jgi:uncharacterized membrane protein
VIFKRIIDEVFPRPRRRPTLWSAAPLVAFLAAFAATWITLELTDTITFTEPWALALLAVAPWVWWMHVAGSSGLPRARAVVALLVRLMVVGAFVMMLAGPRAVRTSDRLALMYAVDVSDSIGEQSQIAALGYVARTVAAKPPGDRAGLVAFGANAAAELAPRESFPLEGGEVILNSRIARDGTNIERALRLALACLPSDQLGRIVLISDGSDTEGTLSGVLGEAVSRDIAIDVLSIDYDYPREVWLERIELPKVVKSGETYEASIILSSIAAGSGRLSLRENGKVIFEDTVTFEAGKSRYTLPLYMRGPGFYEYLAKIVVPAGMDGRPENNVAQADLYLKGEGRTLIVTDPSGDARDWKHFVDACTAEGIAVDVQSAYDFPRDAVSLMPYDCIAVVNVPADTLDAMQMKAMKDGVYALGIGFVMVGGKNSFGPGGYHRTAVEELLPVTMDVTNKKVLPKGALAIILHTCEFAEGNTWAKRIAKAAIKVLGAEDEVGILAFGWNGGYQWVFELTPAGEYEKLLPLINKAQIGDMPDFATTMQMGLTGLTASDAAVKHMIIISDGDPSPPTPALLRSFVAGRISISTVAINPHGGVETQTLRQIAGTTGGRYYFPKDPKRLPSIFVKEAKTLKRSMIQNKTFVPTMEFPSPILKGIETVRQLHGYVLTTPKPRAKVILKGPETEQMDPVLATWRHGLGTTAAFTSDLSPNWGREWVAWGRYRSFVKQLVTGISRVDKESFLRMSCEAAGIDGTVSVEDYHSGGSFLEIQARVIGPDNRSELVSLRQTGARRYQGAFRLWGMGRYQVQALGTGDGRNETALGGFVVPYSPEYLRFRSDPIELKRIAERTKGRLLSGQETGDELFNKGRKPSQSSRPIEDIFLIILACAIPIDVGIRRIQLDFGVIRGWFTRKQPKGESGETMGALLRVKRRMKTVKEPADTAEPATRVPPPAAPSAPPPRRKQADVSNAKKAEKEPGLESLSTTERLLALKRKRQQKKDGSE